MVRVGIGARVRVRFMVIMVRVRARVGLGARVWVRVQLQWAGRDQGALCIILDEDGEEDDRGCGAEDLYVVRRRLVAPSHVSSSQANSRCQATSIRVK